MDLLNALRLSPTPKLALTGSGGKTTAMFQVARQLKPPVLVTATTHLGIGQTMLADRWIAVSDPNELPPEDEPIQGVLLVTGTPDPTNRTSGISPGVLERLRVLSVRSNIPLLIEADGSRQKPLKAPGDHEPVIPAFCDTVVVVAGLAGLGKPLDGGWAHRPERFAELSGLAPGDVITSEALERVLIHPQGGQKGIPPGARRIVLLNQADTPELQAAAGSISGRLLPVFESVLVACLMRGSVFSVHERAAGIILAAGASRRFGAPKLLLDWQGMALIRYPARAALAAGLDPVIVVAGEHTQAIRQALEGLEVTIIENLDWQSGQSSSVRSGLAALPDRTGSVVFLLGDQPQVSSHLIRSLVEQHSASLAPIVAPIVDGQRANPVLFDRSTFADLSSISGDTGGRALFSRYPVQWVDWHDAGALFDIDTPDDYRRLLEG